MAKKTTAKKATSKKKASTKKRQSKIVVKPRPDDDEPLKGNPNKTKGEYRREKAQYLRVPTNAQAVANGKKGGSAKKHKRTKSILKEIFSAEIPQGILGDEIDKHLPKLKALFGDHLTIHELFLWVQVRLAITNSDTSAFRAILDRYEGRPDQMVTQIGLDGGTYEDFLNNLAKDSDEETEPEG